MPVESVLFLVLVGGALFVFAVTLAYGNWATTRAAFTHKPELPKKFTRAASEEKTVIRKLAA